LGALLTDIVLQSGLNYTTVVKPRVMRVLKEFTYASTTPLVKSAVKVYGVEYFLNWQNSIKTQRFIDVLIFCQQHKIDDEEQLRNYLIKEENRERFLTIDGVGPKTVDYALKLMGVECVAVDRHIYNFVKAAGIKSNEYHRVKKIVEYAADLLNLPRAGIDDFIWTSMFNYQKTSQSSFLF